jgi:hypothetical protein
VFSALLQKLDDPFGFPFLSIHLLSDEKKKARSF